MPTDDELLLEWRSGSARAADALFERHFDELYRFFRNKAPEACDDLVQATLLGCFEGQSRFRRESSFRTFMFAVARNQLLSWLRQRGKARAIDPASDSVADLGPSPSAGIQERREQRLLLASLRRIPIDAQILLELYYWERLSGSELAEVLGAPEGTVRTRLRRARHLLKEQMETLGASAMGIESTVTQLDDWAATLRGTPGLARRGGTVLASGDPADGHGGETLDRS